MKKRLFKSILVISFLLITFFCIRIDSNAASFAYSDFDWNEFLKQHKNYWVEGCDEDDDECVDKVLETKEKFFTRLYELLAEFEKKGYLIKDYYIIETVFYGLTPDSFADAGTHEAEYKDQIHKYGYKIDETEEKNKFIGGHDGEIDRAYEYFKKETDSLKTLMNNMIGYSRPCYGISGEKPYTITNSDGTTSTICNGEFNPMGNECVVNAKTIKTDFFDSIGLGLFSGNNSEEECKEATKDYVGYKLGDATKEAGVNEDLYWEFLKENRYFDNKFQLQGYFETVLRATNHKSMEELSEDEYKKYNNEIIAARTRIVEQIDAIIKSYGEFADQPSSTGKGDNKKYWWPIGGADITESDGVKMAVGDPVSTKISSKFGIRVDPVYKTPGAFHRGIDIGGTVGKVPVIAAANGVVVKSAAGNTGTCVQGNGSCGGGYGNYIIIQHTDGNYTLYAHMHTNTVLVKEGDAVKQGQVVGMVGSTGKSTGGHLHFEVRVGGNDGGSAQDPLKFISAENPRATGTDNQLLEWIGMMEGTGEIRGNNYVVYQKPGDIPTVGHGITLKWNADAFRAHGIDPNTLHVGSLVPIDIVDAIYYEDVQRRLENIRSQMSSKGITLSDNQIAALISLQFNCGNINGFHAAYKKYGSTKALCTNWWEQKALHDSSGTYLSGLKKRRIAECNLFVNNVYDMNVYD